MLRRATRADIDHLATIHATAFTGRDAWSRDVFDMQLQLPNVFALIYIGSGMILVRIAANEAEILTVAVVPAARRNGIGSLLLHEATSILRSVGVSTVFLEVSVINSPARATYAKAGFASVGRRPRYYSDGSDALVLRLDLDPPERS